MVKARRRRYVKGPANGGEVIRDYPLHRPLTYHPTPQIESWNSESYFFFSQSNTQSMIKRFNTLFEERSVTIFLKGKGGASAPPDRNLSGS